MHPVHLARRFSLATCLAALLLAAVMALTPGARWVAWSVAFALLAVVATLLGRGLASSGAAGLGTANRVTLTRAVLVCAVAGLAVESLGGSVSLPVLTVLAAVALVLDAVDGHLARRTGGASALGARFDMETDALLILALSVYLAPQIGAWVLLGGLARYLLLVAQRLRPRLRGPVPPRTWRKVVAAGQGVALVVATSGVLPRALSSALVALALVLLAVSFGTEIAERLRAKPAGERQPRSAGVRRLTLCGAVLLVWLTLVVPSTATGFSPWQVLRVPIEGLVLVCLVLLLPERGGRVVSGLFGLFAVVLLMFKALNIGFEEVLDRSFSPLGDWGPLNSGIGVLADSIGHTRAMAVVVAVIAGALLLLVLVPLATLRIGASVRGNQAAAVRATGVLAVLALVPAAVGWQPLAGREVASASSVALAAHEIGDVRSELHDRSVFAHEIADDSLASSASSSGPKLLEGLRGKDVLLVFIESYGRVAVHGSSFAPGIDSVLKAGTRQLRAAGYRSRSAFLTSPTFGAGSWLAHSTLQSGLWVNSQLRYDQLLDTQRFTLTTAFDRGGWRTVFDIPAVTNGWSQGQSFYGFDKLYDEHNVGYRGPTFGYATMPDQFTLAHFAKQELEPKHRRPVMAEIDLVSSHHPWAPLPHMVPWSQVGNGSIFDPMPAKGDTAADVLSDSGKVKAAYGQSIRYTLRALVSFLTRTDDRNLVVVMLGDHQPHSYVSGPHAGHDVPITVLARDPDVTRRIESWGWQPGLLPASDAPLWRMDAFRDRFLAAFSGADGTRRTDR